ncbi:MAG: TIGR04255 family protein [Thiohalocapsa sp.]
MDKPITYNRAPLVELIVQVQWPVQILNIPGAPPIVAGHSAMFDIWFQRLTGVLRDQGFHELERLIPHDMPVLAGSPLYRYRRAGEPFPIVQFGHGIFTINAGPPNYHSWNAFRPYVDGALKALINSKPEDLNLTEFTKASLRYIDAFDDDLRRGTSNFAFIRDDLGVSITLPDGLLELTPSVDQISPTLSLRIPIQGDEGATLAFQLAAGRLGSRPAIETIMDMTYTVDRPVALTADAALAALQNGYQIIHAWFEKLTENLRNRMEPVEEA